MKDSSFLLVTHFYYDDLIKEFHRLQDSVAENCFILYHQKEGNIIDNRILALPHFIFDKQSIGELGYQPLVAQKILFSPYPYSSISVDMTYQPSAAQDYLVPGSNHFPLIKFSQKHQYRHYWYLEYDVRFTGNWKTLFDYFDVDSDFLTAHIRRYKEEPEWHWWNALLHPDEWIAPENRLRSFNPIYRISYTAIKHIDEMHKAGWVGHHEVLMPTLLHKGGFKLRDFGGTGEFVHAEDKGKFYIDATSHLLLDGSLCYCNRPLGYEQVKDKIFHPIKPASFYKRLTK